MFADRCEAARARLDADALVLGPGPNGYYLSGFYGEPGDRHVLFVCPREGGPRFVAPDVYAGQVRDASDHPVHTVGGSDPASVVGGLFEVLDGPETLALDPELPFAVTRHVDERLPDGSLADAGALLGPLRLTKDATELAALRRSAGVADAVSETICGLGVAAIGETEADLAREIRARLFSRGATDLSFPPVVASGPNGGRPAHRHGDREIRPGEPVVLDFGAVVGRYASDQTRTVVFDGDSPEEFPAAHDAVCEALDAGVAAAEPGATTAAVDEAVRGTLADHGLAERFAHDTGHGVGLRAHEAPAVGPDTDTPLEAGVVFSVEPGVYCDDWGVRVEDVVCVTEDGAERLNESSRGWWRA